MKDCSAALNHARESLCAIVQLMLYRARSFDLLDWSMLKVCLISLGMLLGARFSRAAGRFRWVLKLIFAATWIYTMYRLLFANCED